MNDNAQNHTPTALETRAFNFFVEMEKEAKNDDEDLQLFLDHFRNELSDYKAYIDANHCDEHTAFLKTIWQSWENQKSNGNGESGTPEPATADTSTPEQRYMIPLPTDEDVRLAQSNGDTSTIQTTEQSDFFICKSANQWIQEAKQRPNPEPLYMTLWFQGEHCCLFADSNIGKSVLAVQIATAIAPNRMVLLFDFELSDKMFQMRYTDDETQHLYNFPPNLLRLELNPESKDIITANLEDAIIKNIELAAISKNAQIIIIDNLTWLSNQLEKGDAAGQLMQSLQGLTRKYGWSILSIAHTPKRNLSNPVTQNDLAGSKKLMNFFDSAFAIARSRKDERLVYVKQIKVRNDVFRYGEDNVIVYEIVKNGAFLHLKQIGYATEREHLQSMDEQEKNALKDAVIALLNEGKTQKQAAAELG